MVSWSFFLLAVSKGCYQPPNLFSGAQMVGVIVLKTISCMATFPNHPKQNPSHTSVFTHGEKSPKLYGFMMLPACFCIVESSHPKHYLKDVRLPRHDWAGKLEQRPGHWTKKTASLKYCNSVMPATKTNAFLWCSGWKPALLAEELVRVNMSINMYSVKTIMGCIFQKFQLWNRVKS